jgi:tetratricopeptide (TPR) repeat protein
MALLRELDPDGTFGLRDANPEVLERAVERVHGVPRALEVLASIAATDFTSLQDVLQGFYADERVVADLVEEAYKRLDDDSRLTLIALSVFTRPVPPAAVQALVVPLAPGLDVVRVLRRLAAIHLVRIDRDTQIVTLHPVDRDYARSLIPEEGPGSRRSLEAAAADYWMRVRIPPDQWHDLADIEPHLLEIEHRFNAGDMRGAAETLSLLDSHQIAFRWDARRLLELRERLSGKLDDPRLQMLQAYGLGRIYSILGPTSRQKDCIEEALDLARQLGDERMEREALTRLGDTYRKLGDQDSAYMASEKAAALHRSVGDRIGESRAISQMSLAESYRRRGKEAYAQGLRALEVAGDDAGPAGLAHDTLTLACYLLDRFDEALEHSQRAIALYEEARVPDGGAYAVNEQGLIYLRLGRVVEAIEALERVRSRSAVIGSPRLAGFALFNLAHAYLAHDDPETAGARAEAAVEALARAGEPGGAEGARALAAAAKARAEGDAPGEADALAESARVVGWNPDLYVP